MKTRDSNSMKEGKCVWIVLYRAVTNLTSDMVNVKFVLMNSLQTGIEWRRQGNWCSLNCDEAAADCCGNRWKMEACSSQVRWGTCQWRLVIENSAFLWLICGILLHLCLHTLKGKFWPTIYVSTSVAGFFLKMFIFRAFEGWFLFRILELTSVAVFVYVHFMCNFKGNFKLAVLS